MSDKQYLQAASMKTLLNGLSGLNLLEDGSVSPKDKHGFRPGRFFKHGKVAAELLRRFAALEAERDALKTRLAEAERLVKICRKCIDSEDISVHLDCDLDDFIATIQPPTAEGGDHGNE